MRKGALCAFIFAIFTLFLSGCWDTVEIENRAFLSALGLDATDKDEVELIARSPIARAAGGQMGGGGPGGPSVPFMLYSARGKTPGEATLKLDLKMDRRVDRGALRMVLVGERLAKKGVHELLDTAFRDPVSDQGALVFLAKGDLKELMGISPPIEVFPTLYIERYIYTDSAFIALSTRVPIWEAYVMVHDPSRELFLPVIRGQKGKPPKGQAGGGGGGGGPSVGATEESQDRLDITGIAAFKGGKLKGILEGDDAMAFLWAAGRSHGGTFTLKFSKNIKLSGETIENGEVTLWIVGVKRQLKIKRELGRFKVDLDIYMTAQLLSAEGMRFFPWNDELFEYTRRRAEGEVKRMTEKMLAKLQKDFGTDALSLGEFARRRFPRGWKPEKWKEEFPDIEINVHPRVVLKELTFIY